MAKRLAMTGSPSWTAPVGVMAVATIAAGFLLFLLTRRRPASDYVSPTNPEDD